MKEYYDKRAPEYDDWYLGRGLFELRDRAGWDDELERLFGVIHALEPGRTLDVACGTGFLTKHLRGDVVGLDQSKHMLDEAHKQAPSVTYVQGDGLALPFVDHSFDRVFTGHFYGHLGPTERQRFLAEARRVADGLVVVDASIKHSGIDEERSQRVLGDGSTWEVYKRWFTGAGLAEELGGGNVLFEGDYFVVVIAG